MGRILRKPAISAAPWAWEILLAASALWTITCRTRIIITVIIIIVIIITSVIIIIITVIIILIIIITTTVIIIMIIIAIEPLKTYSGLEPVPRCEPSSYQRISQWLSHCTIGALLRRKNKNKTKNASKDIGQVCHTNTLPTKLALAPGYKQMHMHACSL